MFFKFLNFEGPSQYVWKDPDTGREFKENTKDNLISRIKIYRAQNNLEEIEHLSFVLENYWCGLPENSGKCVPVEMMPRGLMGYLKGGIAFVKNMLYDRTVSQTEADRRADICVGCTLNVFPDRGGFIHWSNQIAEASVGSRISEKHDELGQCAGCTCPLRAKVFYAGTIDLRADQETVMRNANLRCWQLPENLDGRD